MCVCVCVCMFLIEINTISPNDLKFCMQLPFDPALAIGYVKFQKVNLEGQERPK